MTAEAYDEFLVPLRKQITQIVRESSTEDASAAIQELVMTTDFDPGWIGDIEAALERNGLSDHAVAVRSSGTMEDLPGAAFAGQHDTFLGERGAESIALAVRRC